MILADEPTANLDSQTGRALIELMKRLNQEQGVTFVFSTHDPRLLEHVTRIVRLEDGRVVRDEEGAGGMRATRRPTGPAGHWRRALGKALAVAVGFLLLAAGVAAQRSLGARWISGGPSVWRSTTGVSTTSPPRRRRPWPPTWRAPGPWALAGGPHRRAEAPPGGRRNPGRTVLPGADSGVTWPSGHPWATSSWDASSCPWRRPASPNRTPSPPETSTGAGPGWTGPGPTSTWRTTASSWPWSRRVTAGPRSPAGGGPSRAGS